MNIDRLRNRMQFFRIRFFASPLCFSLRRVARSRVHTPTVTQNRDARSNSYLNRNLHSMRRKNARIFSFLGPEILVQSFFTKYSFAWPFFPSFFLLIDATIRLEIFAQIRVFEDTIKKIEDLGGRAGWDSNYDENKLLVSLQWTFTGWNRGAFWKKEGFVKNTE